MDKMFSSCSSLKELDLSNFNINKIKNIIGMFSFCYSLKELNLSNFNTNKIREIDCLPGCDSLEKKFCSDENIKKNYPKKIYK